MPLFNSQQTSNSPLQAIFQGDVTLVTLFNAESPTAGQASVAVAVAARTHSGGPPLIALQFECANMGAGVFQIQESDGPNGTEAGNYVSANFNGATPGQVVAANLNASGVGRVELQVATKYVRVLCVTAATGTITVRIGQR